MSACYSCHQILNKKNSSFKHIIPNSIGGILKSARLICRACNSAYGMTIDAALAKDFENIVAFINIERDRSRPYIVKKTIAPELKIHSSVGSDLFMRSVAKIAVNYYLMKVRGRHHLDKVIGIINGMEANEHHIHYYPLTEVMWNDNEISHVIMIKGNASLKHLYAHVILFDTYSVVVNLCDDYNGEDVDLFYRYDILRQEEINSRIEFQYDKDEILAKRQGQREEWNKELTSAIQRDLGRILHIAEQKQSKLSLKEIIDRTLDKAISQYPTGTVITQEILNEIHGKVFAKINEFLTRNKQLAV